MSVLTIFAGPNGSGKSSIIRRVSFAGRDNLLEADASGTWTTRAIRNALLRDFFACLVYICVDSPEKSIQRVHKRVAQGGHDVPDDDVRRRYWPEAFRNLSRA